MAKRNERITSIAEWRKVAIAAIVKTPLAGAK
jgi:hypothetical protein